MTEENCGSGICEKCGKPAPGLWCETCLKDGARLLAARLRRPFYAEGVLYSRTTASLSPSRVGKEPERLHVATGRCHCSKCAPFHVYRVVDANPRKSPTEPFKSHERHLVDSDAETRREIAERRRRIDGGGV